MSLSSYLAKNYLTASAAPSPDLSTRPKKRRKKEASLGDTVGLIIADDDTLLLSSTSANLSQDADEDSPFIDSHARSAEFRRAKKNNWKTVGVRAPINAGHAEAERILASAAAETDRARAAVEAEDAPAIVADVDFTGPRMESGARAGLQTAADTEAMELEVERLKNAELKAAKLQSKKGYRDYVEPEEQTVYRDATGRRIDVSMKRAEARAAEQERLRQEKKEKEDAMGEVQKQEKERRKQDLEDARFFGVARHVDDEKMNEELKDVVRWDDPMAEYMASKRAEEKGGVGGAVTRGGAGRGGGGGDGRKVYKGAAPPNRYGIKPGWRWDGVDRGNGFEKEWFQARGRKSRNENLEYQWQMDE